MKHEIKVPEPGESITEVFIGTWQKKSGDMVAKDEVLVDLETEKTSFEIHAEVAGKIDILFPEAETKVKPGDVIGTIDDSAKGAEEPKNKSEDSKADKSEESEEDEAKSTAEESDTSEETAVEKEKAADAPSKVKSKPVKADASGGTLSPAAKKIAEEKGIDVASLVGSGKDGRVTKADVQGKESETKTKTKTAPEKPAAGPKAVTAADPSAAPVQVDEARGERRERASRIRRTIAANLVAAQQNAAILTTFNEVDMSEVMEFRKKHNEAFKAKHGVKLGMVSFFARAAIRALKEFPQVNATFTGDDIIFRDFVDLSVAVSTDLGLVVPVIRDAEQLSLAQFESAVAELGKKAQEKKLSIEEMSGGTFTISNGGIFGSLLSTPILNRPQSAILGLHKIQERAVVINHEVEVRPMMYLALSYDHRIIDGKEAVQFLVKIKEGIEDLYHIVSEDDLI